MSVRRDRDRGLSFDLDQVIDPALRERPAFVVVPWLVVARATGVVARAMRRARVRAHIAELARGTRAAA